MSGLHSDQDACTLYLVRHGDSRQDDVKRYIGQTDPPLNARGRAQARSMRQQLADIPFRRIYCSDLRRCRETARIIGGPQGKSLRPRKALREIALGAWDGLPMAEIRQRYPSEYEKRGREILDYRPPGGESFADLEKRVLPAVLEVLKREQGPILMVGHAGVNRIVLCHVLQRPLAELFSIRQGYCCLNIIEHQHGRFEVQTVNQLPEPV
jgi:probable phosphoglycerate mutase